MVGVPALTFGIAVICTAVSTQRALEERQREAGRAALGIHKQVPNEAIQGDLRWSTFKVRKAVAKLAYSDASAISCMGDGPRKCTNTSRYDVLPPNGWFGRGASPNATV